MLLDGFRDAIQRAGIPHLRFHDLRHTAGSWLAQAGVSMHEIKRILGHASIRTTETFYLHFSPDFGREAARALDGVVSGVVSGPAMTEATGSAAEGA